VLYLRMHIALLHLHDGRVAQAKAIVIDEGKTALEAGAYTRSHFGPT
jgi:peptidyl-tRNA hydrolase